MGTRYNRLGEAVLTITHNLCFEQKYEKYQSFLCENFQFLEMKFSIYLYRRVFVMVFALIFVLKCCFFNHYIHLLSSLYNYLGWLGEAKVSCILRHRSVQLILAYSWARPAIFAAVSVEVGWGGGECFYFFCFFTIIHLPSSPVPLFHFLYYLFYSLSLGDDTKWPTRVGLNIFYYIIQVQQSNKFDIQTI